MKLDISSFTVCLSLPLQTCYETGSIMERLTTKALTQLPREGRSRTEVWMNQPERHEEFAVRGSTNIVHHNMQASQNVLSAIRNLYCS